MEDRRLLKSYVWHEYGDECFFVSTIMRDSSACVIPAPRFAETIAWEYDWEKRERGEIVAEAGSGYAPTQHWKICEALFKTGKAPPEDKE